VKINCLPKTQLLANTQVDVLEVSPAQWLYPKVRGSRRGYKDS